MSEMDGRKRRDFELAPQGTGSRLCGPGALEAVGASVGSTGEVVLDHAVVANEHGIPLRRKENAKRQMKTRPSSPSPTGDISTHAATIRKQKRRQQHEQQPVSDM